MSLGEEGTDWRAVAKESEMTNAHLRLKVADLEEERDTLTRCLVEAEARITGFICERAEGRGR